MNWRQGAWMLWQDALLPTAEVTMATQPGPPPAPSHWLGQWKYLPTLYSSTGRAGGTKEPAKRQARFWPATIKKRYEPREL